MSAALLRKAWDVLLSVNKCKRSRKVKAFNSTLAFIKLNYLSFSLRNYFLHGSSNLKSLTYKLLALFYPSADENQCACQRINFSTYFLHLSMLHDGSRPFSVGDTPFLIYLFNFIYSQNYRTFCELITGIERKSITNMCIADLHIVTLTDYYLSLPLERKVLFSR